MNRILKHIVLPSGLHALQTKQDGSDIIRTEIFTEEEIPTLYVVEQN